jgi:hypothetical protein
MTSRARLGMPGSMALLAVVGNVLLCGSGAGSRRRPSTGEFQCIHDMFQESSVALPSACCPLRLTAHRARGKGGHLVNADKDVPYHVAFLLMCSANQSTHSSCSGVSTAKGS